MTFRNEIKRFFHEYVDAFVRHDADALSELWVAVGLDPGRFCDTVFALVQLKTPHVLSGRGVR